MTSAAFVSFIVPTLDRHDALERFLASADAQRVHDYEIVIVDQGSRSAEGVAAAHPRVRFFRSDVRGLSHARNVGIRHATGTLFVFADDDCVLADDYLEVLVREASRLSEPLVFGFGNAVTLEDGRPVVPTFKPSPYARSWQCDTLCSISLVLNRHTLERVGAFDESFGIGALFPACEETDLLLRVIAAGGHGIHLERLTIRHPQRARTADLVPRYESFGFAQGALARKHVHDRVFLARFGYGLMRSIGGLLTGSARGPGLSALYRAALRGKLRGFRAYATARRPFRESP